MRNLSNFKIYRVVKLFRNCQFIIHLPVMFLLIFSSCKNPLTLILGDERTDVLSQLQNRSFRQFSPSIDADQRKAVIIDFSNHKNSQMQLWGQYSEGGKAVNEWQASSEQILVYKNDTYYQLTFFAAVTQQTYPEKCEDCIITNGVSIEVRNIYNDEKIEFRINDTDNVLPRPFPVFSSWTRFNEDERVN